MEYNEGLGSIRTKKAPKKTIKAYKLMRLVDGKLYPLFIDSSVPTEIGVWYDADSTSLDSLRDKEAGFYYLMSNEGDVIRKQAKKPTKTEVEDVTKMGLRYMYVKQAESKQRRYGGYKQYYNVGINGSGAVSPTYAIRPGWHAGSLPTMRQIGKGSNKDKRDDSFVWTEVELSADVDYNPEAQRNPEKDIPDHIPEDGYYMKATNADKKKSQADLVGWYVAGAMKINRIISDKEARQIIDRFNAKHPGQKKVEYDYDRESGKEFDAGKMMLEGIRRYYGGNSGYEGYSKSKRAIAAENIGLKTISKIDKDFADEVSEKVGKKITAKKIKDEIKKGNIDYDEWHHTSMYGNKTYYYSVDTVSSFFDKYDEHESDINPKTKYAYDAIRSIFINHNKIYHSYYEEEDGTRHEYMGSFNDSDNPNDWNIVEYVDREEVGNVKFDTLPEDIKERLLVRRETQKRWDSIQKVFNEERNKTNGYDVFNEFKVTPNDVIEYAKGKGVELSGTTTEHFDEAKANKIFARMKKAYQKLVADGEDPTDALLEIKREVSRRYPREVYADVERPKVTIDDYFIFTEAEFTPIQGKGKEVWNELSKNKDFELIHDSGAGSVSRYLYNKKTKEIFRISDHWGAVKSCRWRLKNFNIDKFYNSIVGKCKLKDFKRRHVLKESTIVMKDELETYRAFRMLKDSVKNNKGMGDSNEVLSESEKEKLRSYKGNTDGFGLGMLVSYDKSFKEMKPVYTVDSDFDSKHINNLAPNENIPESLISTINNGVTLEQLDEIAHLPICYYKTQLTIHGICPTLKNKDVYGYSALMVNQNKSLGVRWLAIDRKKKLKLADYMGLYDWATYYDSQIFCYRKDFEYEDDNKEQVYNKVVDFINGLDKSKFFGYIEVFDHKKMKSNFIIYVGKQKTYFEVVIYMQGIYEKNIQPFVEEISGEKWNETEKKFEEWKNEMNRRREEREKEEKERIEESNRKEENRRVEFDKWKKENPFPEKFKPMSFDDLQAGDIVGYFSDSYQFKKSYYRLYLNYKRLCRRECDENGKDLNTWGGHVLKKSDFPNPKELFVYRNQPTKETNTDTEKSKSERPTKGEKVEIVDYASDKVAVLGYTKDKYWELKNLGGGHWDKYITIDGERLQGWVFPRSKRAELEKIFGIEKEEDKKEEEEQKQEPEQPKEDDERDTMRMVLKHLVEELGEKEGTSMFEWYCETYNVGISDPIPDTIRYEVFGTNKKAKEIQEEIKEKKHGENPFLPRIDANEGITKRKAQRFDLFDLAKKISVEVVDKSVSWNDVKKIADDLNIEASQPQLTNACELGIVLASRKIANEDETLRVRYEKIRDVYDNQPTISPKDSESRFLQQFSTPAPLAFLAGEFVKGVSNNGNNGRYLEPSAGNGMLTIALPIGNTWVNDLDPIRYDNLFMQHYGKTENGDASKMIPNPDFKGVITNPPFAELKKGEYFKRRGTKDGREIEYTFTKLDYKLAIMALDNMADNGRAAIIIGGKLGSKIYNYQYAYWNHQNMLYGEFASFVSYLNRQYNLLDILYISGNLYAKQGTTFPIVMLLIDGRKKWDDRKTTVWRRYDSVKDAEIKSFTEYFNRIYPHIEGKTETVNNDDKARKLRLAKAKAKALLLYAYAQKNK